MREIKNHYLSLSNWSITMTCTIVFYFDILIFIIVSYKISWLTYTSHRCSRQGVFWFLSSVCKKPDVWRVWREHRPGVNGSSRGCGPRTAQHAVPPSTFVYVRHLWKKAVQIFLGVVKHTIQFPSEWLHFVSTVCFRDLAKLNLPMVVRF